MANFWDDPFGEIQRGIEDTAKQLDINSLYDAGVQLSSLGTVKYRDGKFAMGPAAQAGDEFLGEITGRNLMREQMWLQQRRVADAQRSASEQAQADLRNRAWADWGASTGQTLAAAPASGTGANGGFAARARTNYTSGNAFQTDFLGL